MNEKTYNTLRMLMCQIRYINPPWFIQQSQSAQWHDLAPGTIGKRLKIGSKAWQQVYALRDKILFLSLMLLFPRKRVLQQRGLVC